MSDFSNVTTPADIVKLNQEPQGAQVQIGLDPEKDMETALTIIEQLYNWHVTQADQFTEDGEHSKAKAWAQDAGMLHSAFQILKNIAV